MQVITLCHERVQATETLPNLLPATGILDGEGNLLPGIEGDVTDIDRGDSVSPNHVCNIFTITFNIVDSTGTPIGAPQTVTITDTVRCPGVGVIPGNVCIDKTDIQVHFCFIPVQDDDGTFSVAVTVELTYCLIVSVETFDA